jgi:hypothetical protein
MDNKETAVEWLYSIFELHAKGKREAPNWWDLERAIHMEKEQMGDVYTEGFKRKAFMIDLIKGDFEQKWSNGYPEDFETYYEETYGKSNRS